MRLCVPWLLPTWQLCLSFTVTLVLARRLRHQSERLPLHLPGRQMGTARQGMTRRPILMTDPGDSSALVASDLQGR